MYVMNGIRSYYSVNFRHLKFGQNVLPNGCYFVIKITVKCYVVRTSFVSPPPSGRYRIDLIKNKLWNSSPCLASLIYSHVVLVAHMACSNKIMKFRRIEIEIEIEKSLFKTFMYSVHTVCTVHVGDLIGYVYQQRTFLNILCLSCLVVFVFFCNANNKQLDSVCLNGKWWLCSIYYRRKFFTKLLSFLPMRAIFLGGLHGKQAVRSFFSIKGSTQCSCFPISMVCHTRIQDTYIYKWYRNTYIHAHMTETSQKQHRKKRAAVSKVEM